MEIASSVTSRLRGLLGRRDFTGILLLAPCNDIHTFGMRRPIDVAFIASDGMVLASFREVKAFRRVRCRQASATLERFAEEGSWYECGDRVELKQCVREALESSCSTRA